MSIVKERKTFFIRAPIDVDGTFKVPIQISFDVDEIRLVQLVYVGTVVDDRCNMLIWEGLSNLCMFDNQYNSANINIRINCHGRSIQGLQTFRVSGFTAGEPVANPTDMTDQTIGLVFEAIKY